MRGRGGNYEQPNPNEHLGLDRDGFGPGGPLPGSREAEADEAERLRRLWVEEIDREPTDVEIYGAGCK